MSKRMSHHELQELHVFEMPEVCKQCPEKASLAIKCLRYEVESQQKEIERLKEQLDLQTEPLSDLVQLVIELDKFIDFSAPLNNGAMGIEDVTEINKVFKKFYRVVNPEQAMINEALQS
jgi:hypothetical protein